MKKQIFISLFIGYAALAHAVGDTITLNLYNPTRPTEIELTDMGYWSETYNNSDDFRFLEFDLFSFTHIPTGFGGADVGGNMSYWDGFTYCTSGDTTDYGALGSSDGWVSQQWGCMAGGGIVTDDAGMVMKDEQGKVMTQPGIPYLVAYWGYWVEMNEEGDPCLQVNFTDDNAYKAIGTYICNHPWPYYGNIHGDGFASPFDKEGDCFKLIAHGMNEKGESTGVSVTKILAEFKEGELIQSADWEWMDLTPLGVVSGIYFTMESTDVHNIAELGPNTAVYFCLDKLQVERVDPTAVPSRPTGLAYSATENSVDFSWHSSQSDWGIRCYQLYLDGEEVGSTQDTTFCFNNLLPYREYSLCVVAVSENEGRSEPAVLQARTVDLTVPTAPTTITAVPDIYRIELSWGGATDNVCVTRYAIYVDGEIAKRTSDTTYVISGLSPLTTYLIEIDARDESGNISPRTSVTVTTLGTTDIDAVLAGGCRIKREGEHLLVESDGRRRVSLFNSTGQPVSTYQVDNGHTGIYIGHLPTGVYFARCGDQTLKFIQH